MVCPETVSKQADMSILDVFKSPHSKGGIPLMQHSNMLHAICRAFNIVLNAAATSNIVVACCMRRAMLTVTCNSVACHKLPEWNTRWEFWMDESSLLFCSSKFQGSVNLNVYLEEGLKNTVWQSVKNLAKRRQYWFH